MTLKHITLGCLLACFLALPAAAADTASTDAHAVVDEQAARTLIPKGVELGSTEDEKRYAERAAASPDAKNYKGGDVIVLSASAIAIILLIILVLLLL